MPVSSIAGSTLGGVSSALGGAAKAGGNAFAELFERAKGASSSSVNSATTAANVGELTRDAENQFSEFKRAMQQLFANAGIDTTWEIRLQSDGQGGVRVNADHPDGEKIEQLLQSNPDLIQKFNDLVAAHGRLRAGSSDFKPDSAQRASVVFSEGGAKVVFD